MAGEIQLNSTSFASESGGTITINNATLASAVDLSNHYASTSEVQGTHTTFSGSHSDTATTINLASVSGISAGDYVVGEGIATGTTVSSVGASSVVISAGLDTDGVGIAGGEPISFYKSTKALSPGLVAGGLCRAWVYYNASAGAIKGAFNVSSVSNAGSGQLTVNFTTALPDTNYAVICGGDYGNTTDSLKVTAGGTYSTTAVEVRNVGNTATDTAVNCIAVFR